MKASETRVKDRNDGAPQDDDLKVGPRPLVERLTAVFAGVAAPKFSRLRVEGSLLLSIGLLALSRVALGLVFEHYDYFAWAELSSVLRFVLLISLVAAFFVCRMSRVQGWQPLIFGLTVLMTVSSTVTAVRIDSDLPLSIDLMMLELITALCVPWSPSWQGTIGISSLLSFAICALTGVARPDDLIRWKVLAGETILTVYFVSFKFYYHRQTDLVRRLQRSERDHELMAAMVEWSGDAIISTKLDGTITSWNRRAEAMFGFPQAEAIGQPFTIIVPLENRSFAMSMNEEIKANQGRVLSYEGRASTKDSRFIEISMTLYGLLRKRGRTGRVFDHHAR